MLNTLLFSFLLACNNKPASVASPPTTQSKSQTTKSTPAANKVVVSWEGGSLSYEDVSKNIRGKLTQMEAEYLTNRYNTERGAAEQAVTEKILEKAANDGGFASIDELLKKQVYGNLKEPTESEIQEFYNQVKSQVGDRTLEQIRFQLVASIKQQQSQTKVREYIDGLLKKANVKYDIPYPEVPRIQVSADDDPFLGPKEAPVTIIQFAEYQCGFCGKAGEAIDQVMKAYDGKVKMVYRDFPLSFHQQAVPAAIAANCAGEQGKYWEMHKLLMSNQRALEEANLVAHANTLKLDLDKWNTCRKDPKQRAEVNKDMEDGSAAGVSGTPAFFINGIMLSGALPFEQFKTIIDRELDKG